MAVKPENQEREERLERIRSSLTSPEKSGLCDKETAVAFNGNFQVCVQSTNDEFQVSNSRTSSLLSDSSSSTYEDSFRLYYYTRSEIKRHDTERSAWIVAGDDIYDVTDYVEHHPGGKYSIMKKIGGVVDCTQDMMFHSKSGQKYWKQFLIGKVTKIPSKNGHPVEKEWWKFWEWMDCAWEVFLRQIRGVITAWSMWARGVVWSACTGIRLRLLFCWYRGLRLAQRKTTCSRNQMIAGHGSHPWGLWDESASRKTLFVSFLESVDLCMETLEKLCISGQRGGHQLVRMYAVWRLRRPWINWTYCSSTKCY